MSDSFALYVHVPFCVRKCRYCEFASGELHDTSQADEVVDAILREASWWGHRDPWRARSVHSLYLGGGTPSLLTPEQIRRLNDGLRDRFPFLEDAECTIEANPGTLSPSRLNAWREAGFERVSLGVQSLQEGVLRTLGRIHTADQARRAYRKLRNAGFPRINIDLIFGTNADSALEGWRSTLDEVIGRQPEHISAYALILEEGTPMYEDYLAGKEVKVDEETELAQYEYAMDALAAAGYHHYEISNWARTPEEVSRHNLSYWNGSPYLALGPAGHSFDGTRTRWWNHRDTLAWLEAVEREGHGGAAREELTPTMRYEEVLMLGLRMVEGVDESTLADAAREAGIPWPHPELKELVRLGLLVRKQGKVRCTRRGLVLADEVIAQMAGS